MISAPSSTRYFCFEADCVPESVIGNVPSSLGHAERDARRGTAPRPPERGCTQPHIEADLPPGGAGKSSPASAPAPAARRATRLPSLRIPPDGVDTAPLFRWNRPALMKGEDGRLPATRHKESKDHGRAEATVVHRFTDDGEPHVSPSQRRWWSGRTSTPAKYQEMYDRSVNDSDAFWLEQAETLDWFKKPTEARKYTWDTQRRKIEHTWFEDGELNVSDNCLDRHLGTDRGPRRRSSGRASRKRTPHAHLRGTARARSASSPTC